MKSADLPDFHTMMASVALIMAQGALGQVDDITELADEALQRALTSFQASHMRFWFGSVFARACRLTGRIDEGVDSAKRLAESASDIPGLAYANLSFLLGHAELIGGALPDALTLLHEALAGVERHGVTTGLKPATCFALAEAHAKLGQPAEAQKALSAAQKCVPHDYLFMQTALSLSTGWVLAATGSLTDAVAVVQAAAEDARERVQPTHELACLQAAAQWGDASGAARARELADELSLPLADAVARHAESLQARDGEGLLAASDDYRAIGDRATAADVAAQAAAAFGNAQQRKRAMYAAALARELADACGGLCTPALRTRVGVPLTGREREVIELVIAGLPNRDIAERLVMSVRTVEGHVYRACQRVGASSRADLAAILRSGASDLDKSEVPAPGRVSPAR
jgi:ATP/maltotriose-dependent transcriptional regulator MalT